MTELSLSKNPIENPPSEIIKQGPEAIRNYFKQLDKEKEAAKAAEPKKHYLYEAKLLLVGEERAGKSTIAEMLTDPDYTFELGKKSTEGIKVHKWHLPKKESGFTADFCFNIWDFGGQEIYHATHQFFLTKRSVYLFITEARKDLRFDDFYYWLNIIQNLTGDSPVIMVQNKVDQEYEKNSITEYKKIFPQIRGGLQEITCNNQHDKWKEEYSNNLEGFKKSICDILNETEKDKKLKGLGDALPLAWINIRKEIGELQNQNIRYISILKYYKICEKYDIDRKGADHLSDYFHDLGVFLHFNDIALNNTIFLDFNWITKAIYKVFDTEKIKKQYGQFSDDDLKSIWHEPDFVDMWDKLINLMKNSEFKICYEHEQKKGHYFAPQLFNAEPKTIDWRSYENNLAMQYNYVFMPKGILSQLIVVLHNLIVEDTFWKHGVLLKYDETKAIVTENRFKNENRISIRVEGKHKRDLLAIIGSQLDKINEPFNNLKLDKAFGCICDECKNSPNPYFVESETIDRARNKRKKTIECKKSFDDVDLELLLQNYIPSYDEIYKTKVIVDIASQTTDVRVSLNNINELLKFGFAEVIKRQELNGENILGIRHSLDKIQVYLLTNLPEKMRKSVKAETEILLKNQSEEQLDKITEWLTLAFEVNREVVTEGVVEGMKALKKSKLFETKVKLAVPLVSLFGLKIETAFNLRKFMEMLASRTSANGGTGTSANFDPFWGFRFG